MLGAVGVGCVVGAVGVTGARQARWVWRVVAAAGAASGGGRAAGAAIDCQLEDAGRHGEWAMGSRSLPSLGACVHGSHTLVYRAVVGPSSGCPTTRTCSSVQFAAHAGAVRPWAHGSSLQLQLRRGSYRDYCSRQLDPWLSCDSG